MSTLRLEQIAAGYGKRSVLRDLNLKVEAGEIVALIGPNGAGKSTVLRVGAGFLDPDRGHVWFDREEITNLDPHERVDRGLSYCIQGGRVFSSLSVSENLEMGSGKPSGEKREQGLKPILDLFPNLKPLLNRRAGTLSGGEQQALALGMVLMHQPNMLLLDEPSAGLSPRLAQDLLDKVRRLNRSWGTTILLVEQNIRESLKISSRSVALVNGSVEMRTDDAEKWIDSQKLERIFVV